MTDLYERETVSQNGQSASGEDDKQPITRTRRLLVHATGFLALVGLGALAALFTAPFADPPNADARPPTTLVQTPAARTEDKPAKPLGPPMTASTALRQLTSSARLPDTKDAHQAEPDALAPNDPRWAKTEAPPDAPPLQQRLAPPPPHTVDNMASTDGTDDGTPSQDPGGEPMELLPPVISDPADQDETAAITPTDENDADTQHAPEKAAPAATDGSAPSVNVTVTTDVKMRAGPRDEAAVVAVIPDNAVVGLVKCESWCEIIYKGRRGFVYKGFVDGRGVAAR